MKDTHSLNTVDTERVLNQLKYPSVNISCANASEMACACVSGGDGGGEEDGDGESGCSSHIRSDTSCMHSVSSPIAFSSALNWRSSTNVF